MRSVREMAITASEKITSRSVDDSSIMESFFLLFIIILIRTIGCSVFNSRIIIICGIDGGILLLFAIHDVI